MNDIDQLSYSPTSTRKTVLLVDDDTKLLRALERTLSDERYEVLTAVSPAEARVFLTKKRVDLILSDNLMTGTLGTDFLATVHKEYPHIKLLILSGYLPLTAARRAVDKFGVFCVLTKPCQTQDITDAIRCALSDVPSGVQEPTL